jgi:hypothetical protein
MINAKRSLYKLNRNLMICNAVLFLTVYFGMLFLVVLGLFQVVSSLIIACELKNFTSKIKRLFIMYSTITTVFLILIVTTDFMYSYNDFIQFLTWILLPVALAFLHLYITYLIQNNENTRKPHIIV